MTRPTAAKLIAAHIAEAPAPLATKNPAIPPALARVVMRCLEKDPDTRPSSANEIIAALDNVVTPGGASGERATAMSSATRGSRHLRTLGVGAGILIVAFAAGGFWWATRSARAQSSATEMTLAVLPIENLGGDIDAKELQNKRLVLGCFPWKFKGGEAAFARCVAFTGNWKP